MRIQGKKIRVPRKVKKMTKKEGRYRPDLQKLFFDHPPEPSWLEQWAEAPELTQEQINEFKRLLSFKEAASDR